MLPAGRRFDARAAISLSVFALIATTTPIRAQTGPDPCSWLTQATLFTSLGHHFDAPNKGSLMPVYKGWPPGTTCDWQGASDSVFHVTMVAYVDPSVADAKTTFQKLAGYTKSIAGVDGNSAGTPITGAWDAAYIDEDSTLHVLKGRVRYTVVVFGFPNTQQRQRDIATLILGGASKQ